MRFFLLILLFLVSSCNTQKKVVGLFGSCNTQGWNDYGNCQQVLFKEDSTFIFYDRLHLRGWKISTGIWKLDGHTIVLNSKDSLAHIVYSGKPIDDSVTLIFLDNNKPLTSYVSLVGNGIILYEPDSTGTLRMPRDSVSTFYFHYWLDMYSPIILDNRKLASSSVVTININTAYKDFYNFSNEKWFLKKKKLYFNTSDKDHFFEKLPISELKYKMK